MTSFYKEDFCREFRHVYLLVDCNNFFVSCERLLHPDLNFKPVIVLSNNDGCVVARSDEAKALGIKMGEAVFKIRNLIESKNVAVFSSNFNLYLDISSRVVRTLESMCPHVEQYSIDESFIFLEKATEESAKDLACKVRNTLAYSLGIPVGIGIGTSKTLAKLASYYAKRKVKRSGAYFSGLKEKDRLFLLKNNPVSEVWGIGKRLNLKLQSMGIFTAWQFAQTDLNKLRRSFNINAVQTAKELSGIDCIVEDMSEENQSQIMWSRSFKERLLTKEEIFEALANYTVKAAEKLRSQQKYCKCVHFHIRTSLYGNKAKYSAEETIILPYLSNDTRDFIDAAKKALDLMYRPGYEYMKAGVILTDFAFARTEQSDLFCAAPDIGLQKKADSLMQALDTLNSRKSNTVYLGAQGGLLKDKKYLNRQFLSQSFADFYDLPEVSYAIKEKSKK